MLCIFKEGPEFPVWEIGLNFLGNQNPKLQIFFCFGLVRWAGQLFLFFFLQGTLNLTLLPTWRSLLLCLEQSPLAVSGCDSTGGLLTDGPCQCQPLFCHCEPVWLRNPTQPPVSSRLDYCLYCLGILTWDAHTTVTAGSAPVGCSWNFTEQSHAVLQHFQSFSS